MTGSRRVLKRLLIANRGEIARRIIRTCRVLDIETVAVYSDIDADAPHVHEATFAECIGSAMAYLSVDAILAAAQRSGADSVHPGYGFLSENPALPEALERAGIIFIGPKAETIRALGSKTNAKTIALRAEVPVPPTLLLNEDSAERQIQHLRDFTSQIGLPVIIKAAAGGGGRGMRLINGDQECAEALESARRESLKAFGSAEIFVEKYIAPARHIEVQIAGDIHGNVVALGTRDCSLQRNNQKIIEEAPALGLAPGVSEELCLAACRLAKEVGYSNLGTVEFLYTDNGLFYFLEVNTRLQVEHPVTELVSGLDLVKLQIEIARGAPINELIESDTLGQNSGHAIEARLCAEEYTGRFVTATGVILDMHVPRGPMNTGLVRADMGYDLCSQVSHHYDSLIGKIIAYAPDRPQAIEMLRRALADTRISGVGTNRALLIHLLSTDDFCNQRHTVQGTAALLPELELIQEDWVTAHAIAASTRMISSRSRWARNSPWHTAHNTLARGISYPLATTTHGTLIRSISHFEEESIIVNFLTPSARETTVRITAHTHADSARATGTENYSISIDSGAPIQATLLRDGDNIWVHTQSSSVCLCESYSRTRAELGQNQSGELSITSQIPGKVVSISITEGQCVNEGDLLVVLDSMKMEHPFRSPRDGIIAAVNVTQGEIVNTGEVLVVIS
jgi:propionyl-CoA carboxylase alpha chain